MVMAPPTNDAATGLYRDSRSLNMNAPAIPST